MNIVCFLCAKWFCNSSTTLDQSTMWSVLLIVFNSMTLEGSKIETQPLNYQHLNHRIWKGLIKLCCLKANSSLPSMIYQFYINHPFTYHIRLCLIIPYPLFSNNTQFSPTAGFPNFTEVGKNIYFSKNIEWARDKIYHVVLYKNINIIFSS